MQVPGHTIAVRRHPVAAAVLAMIGAAPFAPVLAQSADEPPLPAAAVSGGLEEIVVTAQRRSENLHDVPISVTAITADSLHSTGIGETTGLPQAVPSVQLTRSGVAGIFFVRGVGNTSGGIGEEGANAFYVDGVFLPDLNQSVLRFNNIERIEVLKGPQGTLFGRNSSGGLVNVITREPGREVTAEFQAGFANYETYSLQAYMASPISETLSADLALTGSDQGKGWGTNLATGEDVSLGWNAGVRSKWLWQPRDVPAKVTLTGEYVKSSDDFTSTFHLAPGSVGAGGTLPPADGRNTNTADAQFVEQRNYGLNLTAEYAFDWATLTSITAMRNGQVRSALDPDGGPLPTFHIAYEAETSSFQEELRLASPGDERLSWQAGVFFLYAKAEYLPQSQRGAALGGVTSGLDLYASQETTSYAPFGEVTYAITPRTHATAGIRYTLDERKLDGREVPVAAGVQQPASFSRRDSVDFEEVTYRAALRQDITDDLNVYASYNRGFKSGLYSLTSIRDDAVKPQTIDAYELGTKANLFGRRLRLNLAAFHYDISDYQVRAATGVGANPKLLNAASVDVDGVELEFEALPLDTLRIFGSFTAMESEFASFPFAPYTYPNPAACTPNGPAPGGSTGAPIGGAITCLGDARGNSTPIAPKFAASIGATYTVALPSSAELLFSAMYNYNDGYFFEVDNRLSQDAYDLVNASITYKAPRNWAVELWGRNLADETYHVQKLGSALADLAVLAPPRTFGVNVRFNY